MLRKKSVNTYIPSGFGDKIDNSGYMRERAHSVRKLFRSYFAHYKLSKMTTSVEIPRKSERPLKNISMELVLYLGSGRFSFRHVKKYK